MALLPGKENICQHKTADMIVMGKNWSREEELAHFSALWEKRPPCHKRHTPQIWDERAKRWESGLQNDMTSRSHSEERVLATADFLRAHDQLKNTDTVLDIGCGPGRFVAEFAKTAKHVTGTDFSKKMLQYGADFAQAQGLANVSFTACDFKTVDIDELGWKERFDLVFSFITPAVSSERELKKAMSLSRGWCFNGSFISSYDGLSDDVGQNIFNKPFRSRFNGQSAYALFNLLWLWGYSPYVSYYCEKSEAQAPLDIEYCAEIAENIGFEREDKQKVEQIYRYLSQKAERDDSLVYSYESNYIWLLWDMQNRIER